MVVTARSAAPQRRGDVTRQRFGGAKRNNGVVNTGRNALGHVFVTAKHWMIRLNGRSVRAGRRSGVVSGRSGGKFDSLTYMQIPLLAWPSCEGKQGAAVEFL
jgi:hypothetical protein